MEASIEMLKQEEAGLLLKVDRLRAQEAGFLKRLEQLQEQEEGLLQRAQQLMRQEASVLERVEQLLVQEDGLLDAAELQAVVLKNRMQLLFAPEQHTPAETLMEGEFPQQREQEMTLDSEVSRYPLSMSCHFDLICTRVC